MIIILIDMAANTPSFVNNYLEKVDKYLSESDNVVTKTLDVIEKKTNVKKRYLVLIATVWVGLYLIFGYAASLLCSFIGFVYPAYYSVKAIESPSGSDDTEWLMYWVVFASFSCLEFFSDILLSWFPFYFLIKCIFLLWCMAPISYNGSKVIYNRLIRPWVLQNENKIDEVLGFVSNNVEKMADKVTNAGASAEADLSQTVTNAVANKIGSILGGSSEQETKKSE